MAVGFEEDTDIALIVSSAGQGVVDCNTGELIFRNRDDDGYDERRLLGCRLDASKRAHVPMAGIHGGALKCVTDDGWHAQAITLKWPETCYLLEKPGASIFFSQLKFREAGRDGSFTLLSKDAETNVAFGFSWTGKTLVRATSSDIQIWHRHAMP